MATLATLSMPTTILLLLLLLLIPTRSNSNTVNDSSASASCDSNHPEKCRLIGDEIGDSEFLMESEIGRMLLGDYNNLIVTPNTRTPNRPVVAACGRAPRYDSCLGEKRQTPPKGKCDPFNRVNTCS